MLLFGQASTAFAGPDTQAYASWSQPGGNFDCEIPADWEDRSRPSMLIVGPGLLVSGYPPSLSASFRKNAGDPDAASNFIAEETGSDYQREVETSKFLGINPPPRPPLIPVSTATVAGKKAFRYIKQSVWTREHPIPGIPLDRHPPGIVSVVSAKAVIPVKDGYWVLDYDVAEQDYKANLPHFEHLLKTFRLKQPPRQEADLSKPAGEKPQGGILK